jgi:hypothetical protein
LRRTACGGLGHRVVESGRAYGFGDQPARSSSYHQTRLWEEYRAATTDGFGYSWFCDLYREWAGRLKPTLRQVHIAGERLYVRLRRSRHGGDRRGDRRNSPRRDLRCRAGRIELHLRWRRPGAKRCRTGSLHTSTPGQRPNLTLLDLIGRCFGGPGINHRNPNPEKRVRAWAQTSHRAREGGFAVCFRSYVTGSVTHWESRVETSRKSAPRARFTSGGRIHPDSCR